MEALQETSLLAYSFTTLNIHLLNELQLNIITINIIITA